MSHLSSFHVLFLSSILKLSKKVLQCCADLSKKSNSIKTIYICTRYALSANGIVYYAMTYCFGFEVEQFFQIPAESASLRTFMCIYVSCFNRLRFLAEVSTKFRKIHFFDNLRPITQERNMETRK